MTEELKPCPWQMPNEEAHRVIPAYSGQPATHYYMKCVKCGATGPRIERGFALCEWTEASKQWNRRAAND